MANWIVCGPPGVPFTPRIAWRSEPAPASFVLVTVKIAAVDAVSSGTAAAKKGDGAAQGR